MRQINEIILHCSASSNAKQDDISKVKELHTSPKTKSFKWGKYDTNGKAWSDVGYHYFIKSDGTLQHGRSIDRSGAHCLNHNKNSIGICLSGNLKSDFTGDQFITLTNLLKALVLLFPKVTIHGHNEFANKTCPVFDVTPFKFI